MTVDELADYGMERMDDEAVRGFLASQRMGVLGLPGETAPVMRPMSYAYDGADTLYFLYVLVDDSRKAALSDRAEAASFLVYAADTQFTWRSAILTGRIEQVPEDERDAVEAAHEFPWRPEVFERAAGAGLTALYRFDVQELAGIKQTGLPPGFGEGAPGA